MKKRQIKTGVVHPPVCLKGRPGACKRCAEPARLLLESYKREGTINHIEGKNLPSKRAIATLSTDLLRLLFPGFYDEKLMHASEFEREIPVLLHSVCRRLGEEIEKSLRFMPECPVVKNLPPLANAIAAQFLRSLPNVREVLRTDAEAAFQGDPAAFSSDEVILAYPFMEAVAIQRMAHMLYVRRVPLVPRMMTEWAHSRTGIDIHPGAEIGDHFYIDHGTGTVIGETVRIGNYVKLYQNVGLVARSLSGGHALAGKRRHPTLEDRVTIYSGVTIMGGDTVVGAESTVGAGVFLDHSVPANSLVVSEQARILVLPKNSHSAADYQI
jgi:serine O-acetyltransferase